MLYKMVKEYLIIGSYADKGWPKSAYGMSKLGINSYSRILAHNEQVKAKNIQVYACSPGYVNVFKYFA